MHTVTFDQYKEAIRVHYESKKIADITGILSNPSPAQLRNLCLFLLGDSFSNNDEIIIRSFLNVKEEESLQKAIADCEISKFRPIRSFLKREKDCQNRTRVELAAILVDYNLRPYQKYAQSKQKAKIQENQYVPIESNNYSQTRDQATPTSGKETGSKLSEPQKDLRSKWGFQNRNYILLGSATFLLLIFAIKWCVFPNTQCMQWQNNHYVAVDCIDQQQGFSQRNTIVPIDPYSMQLKKLDNTKEWLFFKNGKPLLWYSKQYGTIELFNGPGFHPETQKPLKPITAYIIKKYQLKPKKE
ncbi:hypothetical protein LPBF_05785 [Flavobacterium crassostreae]|uniref:Uncharacterized protein n=2 Tax=Flavobacterium crassostreae TaxID=1763534 RepID=A0A1B9E3E2_9FLAO|nr:hypothetical protein LPBF_05785 [Flavobacterium crassostreae]